MPEDVCPRQRSPVYSTRVSDTSRAKQKLIGHKPNRRINLGLGTLVKANTMLSRGYAPIYIKYEMTNVDLAGRMSLNETNNVTNKLINAFNYDIKQHRQYWWNNTNS